MNVDAVVEYIVSLNLGLGAALWLVGTIVLLYLGMLLRDYVIRDYLLSLKKWRTYKAQLNLCIGSVVKMPTSSGFIEGKIVRANHKRVVLEVNETIKFIPTERFMEKEINVLEHGEDSAVS